MKRLFALAAILLVGIGAIYMAQRHTRQDAVSANALVDVAADWQRDVSRAPMRLTRISDAEEIAIGAQLAQRYSAEDRPESARDRVQEQYVSQVGTRVSAHAHRKLTWHFHLVRDPDFVNAFSLPGGQIFIGSGLLNQMQSEDEIAFVLGHEIEHVDHNHAVERVQIEAHLHHWDLDALDGLAEIPMSLWQAGYRKDEEFEADSEGVRIAAAAGYSPRGAVDQLERWTKLEREYVIHAETPVDELSDLAIECLQGYFRSHPLPSERLAQVDAVIAQDHLPMNRPPTSLLQHEITTKLPKPRNSGITTQ